MNLEQFFSQSLNLVGTFDPKIALFLFLLCLIGDIFVSIPYILETVWLFAGYQLSKGILPFYNLLLLVVASQLGRQIGSIILGYIGRIGSMPFMKYKKHFENNSTLKKLLKKINIASPLSVAFGRLFYLRIPLSLILGAKRQFKTLSMGVLISGLVFDTIFIVLGIVVGTTLTLEPIEIFLISVITLTVLYVVNLIFRHYLLPRLFRRN
jgi:membrane-associated protein